MNTCEQNDESISVISGLADHTRVVGGLPRLHMADNQAAPLPSSTALRIFQETNNLVCVLVQDSENRRCKPFDLLEPFSIAGKIEMGRSRSPLREPFVEWHLDLRRIAHSNDEFGLDALGGQFQLDIR